MGSFDDVEHVVVLIQENRSFDHYFGTMAGVRGFADLGVLREPVPPFHIDTATVDGQHIAELPHDWDSTHAAINGGANDGWVAAKSALTMGYFGAADIPFHRALASAFTICDHYFCSVQGPTTPNRLYAWTGTIDPDGLAGGPAAANPPDHRPVFGWTTYPERLQAAGVSWQVYANDEAGADEHVGDYGDNPLWLFHAYHDALASTDPAVRVLAERGGLHPGWTPDSGRGRDVEHVLARFLADCHAGTLPAVSWIVAPQRYSEHPAARPVDGAAYVAAALNGIWSNPRLRDSTVVLLTYDENDGFFDHVPPPVPPPGTPGEFLPAHQPDFRGAPVAHGPPVPIGLGPRVPMTVVSPWSRGGFVDSQVFDHTSVLRFLEAWTGVREPNISAWRRAVCGDLTSCFDFTRAVTSIPALPDAGALRAAADRAPALPAAAPPATGIRAVPRQDAGVAPARPLPYQATADVTVSSELAVRAANHGRAAVTLAVRTGLQPPRHLVVGPGRTATVSLGPAVGRYDVRVDGPNGFLRTATGDASTAGVEVLVTIAGTAHRPAVRVCATNGGPTTATVELTSGTSTIPVSVPPGASCARTYDPFAGDHGWYDIRVAAPGHPGYGRRFTGRLENGLAGVTGPAHTVE